MVFILAEVPVSAAGSSCLGVFEEQPLYRRQLLADNFSRENNQVRVAIFDADSTLRIARSGSVSATTPEDVMILPEVAQRIAQLNQQGYLVMIASNQGQVSRDGFPITISDQALRYTAHLIRAENPQAIVHYIDFAEHNDQFRKPQTGMMRNLEKELKKNNLQIDWKKSFMVGDAAYEKNEVRPDGRKGFSFSNSDRKFAENLNIDFYEPADFFHWRKKGVDSFRTVEQVQQYQAVP